MAEMRCPMCGKENPAELERCQYCQARLRPLETPAPHEPDQEATGPATSPGSEVPDWLGSFRQIDEGAAAPLEPEESATEAGEAEALDLGEEELPEWLRSEEAPSSPAGEPEGASPGDLPEWLAALHLESEEAPMSPPVRYDDGPPPHPGDQEPDWLRDLRQRQGVEKFTPQLAEEAEEQAADQVPEAQNAPPKAEEAVPQETQEPSEGITDWQHILDQDQPSAKAETPAPSAPGEGELPAWLGEIKAAGAPTPASPESEAETPLEPAAEGEEETPGWLSRFEGSPALILDEEEQAALAAEAPLPAAEVEPAPPPAAFSSEEPPQAEIPSSVPPFIFEGEDLFIGGVPDWLKAADEEAPMESAPEESAPDLAPAELPTWVEAMRPAQHAAAGPSTPDESEKEVEGAGPLVGLRGVLPVEPEVARLKKSSLSVRLQIPEKQAERIAILESLLRTEGKTAPAREKPAAATQNILRVLIFLVLALAAVLSLLGLGGQASLPQFPAPVFDASQAVNAIPGGAAVLVVVDYEPAFSAEMDAAAAPLLDHLMLKGAYLTLVSSLPTGPAQAERLVKGVSLRAGHHYQDSGQYANLGYIPGGTSGVLTFAEIPQAALPFAADGSRAWEGEKLRSIRSLADFALVVVLTESPEVARAWIEQAQPLLGTTPMVMVTSAQAEPLVRPYYETTPRQVTGMVAGLAGGAGYERILSRPGLAAGLWGAFGNLNLAAVAIMLVAGLVNVISGALARPRSGGSEGRL
ncbi:MAG: hypothetical protein PHS96_12035 [Anaerolineales bacterium]|nr:hypothetical protein [Anaerolineales bacterium]